MKRIVKEHALNGAYGLLAIAFLALLIINFVVTPMNVDGKSMEPTLTDDQQIWVNQLAYKIGEADYEDIVVALNSANENKTKLVKRVVGKPGDTIEFREGVMYRNGTEMKNIVLPANYDGATGFDAPLNLEDGEYYLLGDNLPESVDSREMGAFNSANFVGKVIFN